MNAELREAVERWTTKARRDLSTACVMAGQGDEYTDIVCYHCQQAVEKLLKAYLVLHGRDFPRTHDLAELATLCASYCAEIASLNEDMVVLTEYAVTPRYPAEEGCEIGPRDAQEALQAAGHACAWIEDRVCSELNRASDR
jgi:HEPN domain-containing protein